MTAAAQFKPPTPLEGLVVVDLSTTLPGAQASQFFADAGATVVMIEASGGSPLRGLPGWPALLRGKRSVVLDLHDERERLSELLSRADVLIHTMRPDAARRRGLGVEALEEQHPHLVSAAITGWGSQGPWRRYKGWEALVMAKTGVIGDDIGPRRHQTLVQSSSIPWRRPDPSSKVDS